MKFLELEIQRKIYNSILNNAGLTSREIACLLKKDILLIERQLKNMERDELLLSFESEGQIRYFINDTKPGVKDKGAHLCRKTIYDLVVINPGLHLSRIAELLNIRLSLVEYHLQNMERVGLISASKEKGYKRYYIADGGVGVREKEIISLLRHEIPLQIVLFLIKNPNSRHKDIAYNLGFSTAALTYHLNKLLACGIVSTPDVNSGEYYNIKNKKEIKVILRKYQLQTVVERFTETWDGFG